jgi:HlyD family secretion protein
MREVSPAEEVESRLGLNTRSRWLRRFLWLVPLLAAIGGAGFFGQRYLRSAKDDGQRYVTEKVRRGDLSVIVTATGTLEAADAVDVSSEISGRVIAVLAEHNQLVKKGQVLAELDPVQLRADVQQTAAQVQASQAALRQAEVGLDEARMNLARAEEQRRLGLISERELESARTAEARARANLSSAQANVRVAQAQASSSRWRLERAQILAPIDGMVLSRTVEPGQTVVSAMQAPTLFRLAAGLEHMELHVQIDEADIGRVREGMTASFSVDAYPGRAFPTRIAEIRNEPVTTQNVVTYEAVLEVDNAERLLRPGMTATASIVTLERDDVLLVPNAALLFTPPEPRKRGEPATRRPAEGEGRKVYVLEGAAPRAVDLRVGDTDGRVSELVSGGLREGQPLIIDMLEEP